ncbi:septum formation family protein [Actinomyces vulturis]|uniref:septum formation family protein n=1 Tax=Actinomyces vulturis TaxID=1857645 RepID=UPI00083410F1|nr:septum formation family protein [Actinomyces vulturis]
MLLWGDLPIILTGFSQDFHGIVNDMKKTHALIVASALIASMGLAACEADDSSTAQAPDAVATQSADEATTDDAATQAPKEKDTSNSGDMNLRTVAIDETVPGDCLLSYESAKIDYGNVDLVDCSYPHDAEIITTSHGNLRDSNGKNITTATPDMDLPSLAADYNCDELMTPLIKDKYLSEVSVAAVAPTVETWNNGTQFWTCIAVTDTLVEESVQK